MRNLLIIVGLSGCGKSSILKKLSSEMPDLKIINYGRVILSIASDQQLEPDTIRKQPHALQKELRIKAAQKIITDHSDGLILVDTHAFIKTKFGFMPGVPKEILDLLKPQGFVMVQSQAEDIHERRLRDKFRSRENQSLDQIKFHQDLSCSFIVSCSFLTGIPLKIIHNKEGHIEDATRKLKDFINHQRTVD